MRECTLQCYKQYNEQYQLTSVWGRHCEDHDSYITDVAILEVPVIAFLVLQMRKLKRRKLKSCPQAKKLVNNGILMLAQFYLSLKPRYTIADTIMTMNFKVQLTLEAINEAHI